MLRLCLVTIIIITMNASTSSNSTETTEDIDILLDAVKARKSRKFHLGTSEVMFHILNIIFTISYKLFSSNEASFFIREKRINSQIENAFVT